jgi:hypothetical protein
MLRANRADEVVGDQDFVTACEGPFRFDRELQVAAADVEVSQQGFLSIGINFAVVLESPMPAHEPLFLDHVLLSVIENLAPFIEPAKRNGRIVRGSAKDAVIPRAEGLGKAGEHGSARVNRGVGFFCRKCSIILTAGKFGPDLDALRIARQFYEPQNFTDWRRSGLGIDIGIVDFEERRKPDFLFVSSSTTGWRCAFLIHCLVSIRFE